MDLSFLAFLAEPWFVGLWYLAGVFGAAWVAYDTFYVNTQVNFALKLAWPIILFSFSVIGLVAYRSRSWSGCGCGSDVTATNGTIAAITGPCS